MRIAIFTETFLPKIDGVVSVLCLALQHLRDKGHQVLVFGPPDMPETYAGHRLVRTGGPRFWLYPELRINLPSGKIVRELHAFQPHVVHVVNPAFLGLTGITLAKMFNLPLVASAHMDITSYTTHYVGAWGVPIAWWLFRTGHNFADLNLVPSSAMLQQVRERGYRRVRWWHRGVDTERFRPDLRSDAMRIRLSGGYPNDFLAIYVGRITREKNVHLLRDAICRMDGVRLALVGGGPELKQMQSYFAGTGTVFTGYLRGGDVAAAYASADVLVFPSTSETFGMAPLEAMACGLPVIGSMTGGLVDTLRDGINALVYDPNNPLQLRERVRLLRDSPDLYARLRQGALEHARSRRWQSTMDQLIGYYELGIRYHRQAQLRRRWRLIRAPT